ncbi:phospholipase D family protein [Paenibacillus sp. P25]|nr:phospholipase D family protein [Paenibacillus sp. P25]
MNRVGFLYDLTYKQGGRTVHEQHIFDRIFQAVDEAERFIVIDMFLFNSFTNADQDYPKLSETLTAKLIERKKMYPGLQIVFITDEVNTTYGSHTTPEFERLKAAGIPVILTDLDALRDSTPLYSAGWRMFFRWFGQSGGGWIPNPMAGAAPKATLRSYLKLLNVKANHRKVIATEKTVIIPSANAHDASGFHSNTALEVSGNVISDVLESEQAAVRLSGQLKLPSYPAGLGGETGPLSVRSLTEGKIYAYVLRTISEAKPGDTIWLGMFYLGDGRVIRELIEAASRGVKVRLILDPNENAFGRDKIGIPNRPAAEELTQKSGGRIGIRWYNTGKEQFHTKMMLVSGREHSTLISGSANFTPRNLDDFNLETDLAVEGPAGAEVFQEATGYFDRLWNNRDAEYTLDYPAYKDQTVLIKEWLYHIQKFLGFTTF